MRSVFILGRQSEDGIETVHVFGAVRPDRAHIRKAYAEYPEANCFASYPDVEDERRNQVTVLHAKDLHH